MIIRSDRPSIVQKFNSSSYSEYWIEVKGKKFVDEELGSRKKIAKDSEIDNNNLYFYEINVF